MYGTVLYTPTSVMVVPESVYCEKAAQVRGFLPGQFDAVLGWEGQSEWV